MKIVIGILFFVSMGASADSGPFDFVGMFNSVRQAQLEHDGKFHDTVDTIKLKKASKIGYYNVSIQSFGHPGNSCTFMGPMKQEGDRLIHTEWAKDHTGNQLECKLILQRNGDMLDLDDIDGNCGQAAGYCTGLAELSNVNFKRSVPKKLHGLVLDPKGDSKLSIEAFQVLKFALKSKKIASNQWRFYVDGRTCMVFKSQLTAMNLATELTTMGLDVTEVSDCRGK